MLCEAMDVTGTLVALVASGMAPPLRSVTGLALVAGGMTPPMHSMNGVVSLYAIRLITHALGAWLSRRCGDLLA
jgi:hypothetical protein